MSKLQRIKDKLFKSKYCEDCQKIQRRDFRRTAIAYLIIFLTFGVFIWQLETNPTFYYDVALVVNEGIDGHNHRMFYNLQSEYSEDIYVQSIVNICSLENKSSEKVKCVHEIATRNFVYLDDDHYFYAPNEILTKGGVCRDWTVLFGSIYSSMGYVVTPVFLVDHVYIVINDDNKAWKIDQQLLQEITLTR